MKNFTKATPSKSKLVIRTTIAISAFAVLQASSQAATYYVSPTGNDTNAGTIAKPFASLYRATSKTAPGDIVYLRGGTYKYTVPQTIQGTGTATAYLNLLSYPGETAILDFAGSTAGKDAVQVAGNYVRISNLTVQNSPKANISVWGSSYVSVRNVRSTGAKAAGILVGSTSLTGTFAGKVGTEGNHDVEISGCEVWNCGLSNVSLTAANWQPAIQTFQSSKVQILNNNVHQNYGEGIGVCTTSSSQITGNKAWDNFSVNIYLDNVDTMTVSTNFAYTTGDKKYFRGGRAASGISMAVEGVTNPIGLRNSVISNNTIYNCFAGIWYSSYGLGGGLKNFTITKNTVYKTTGGPLLWVDSDKGHVGNTITGNVFQQSGATLMANIASMTGLTMGNNCWFGGTVGTGKQGSDLLANPLLLRPGSYTLADYDLSAQSPCLSKGIGASSSASQTKA
jgi:hypothetical protein